jgi:hypothetical protein
MHLIYMHLIYMHLIYMHLIYMHLIYSAHLHAPSARAHLHAPPPAPPAADWWKHVLDALVEACATRIAVQGSIC